MKRRCPYCQQFTTNKFCGRLCELGASKPLEAVAEKFWSQVQKTDGCWSFQGPIQSNGYGIFYHRSLEPKQWRAHRLAWLLVHGRPVGMVCHRCDNPVCVNPSHLFLSDAAGNSRDMVLKDRHASGDRHPAARLTYQSAHEIRDLRKNGLSYSQLAALFRVSKATIAQVVTRKIWKRQS